MKLSTIVGLTCSQSSAFIVPFAPVGSMECQMICDETYSPVCGSDGATYYSKCVLKRTACLRGLNLEIDYNGECNVRPSRKCPKFCNRMLAPVCGSDGETYPNRCVLEQTACKNELLENLLVEVSEGPCDSNVISQLKGANLQENNSDPELTIEPYSVLDVPTIDEACPTMCSRMYAPVCGSNGITYGNKCMMIVDSCERKEDITKMHDGECKEDQSTESNTKECNLFCTREYNPVCGQVGDHFRIYSNACTLGVASCLTDGAVIPVHQSKCNNEDDLATEFNLKKSGESKNQQNKRNAGKRARTAPMRDVSKLLNRA